MNTNDELDTASSASRQHYIDTGRYLTHAEQAETRTFPNAVALDMLAELLSGTEWDASTIERVAELIQLTGRTIDDYDES